jgi:hypothetical protein
VNDQRPSPTGLGATGWLLVVLVLSLLLWHALRPNVSRWMAHVSLTRAQLVPLLVVPVLVLTSVVGALWLRRSATRRTLASRVSYVVLPSDDFDPSEDAVLRAAGQLSRVRRAVLGWLDTPASAVRVRLDSGPDGRMLYRVQVASRARSVVASAITSMGTVELREEGQP